MTIKELRESKGLSQGAFAETIGIGRTSIVGYENGRIKPSEAVLAKIKEVYGVDTIVGYEKGRIKPSTEVAAKIKEVYGIIVDEAGVAPVDEKKTAKRGKKKDTPAEGEVTPSVEEKTPASKKKGGRKKAAPAAEMTPAVEEKKPAAKKPTKRGKKAETAPTAEEKKPAKRGKKAAAPAVEEKRPRGKKAESAAKEIKPGEEKKPAKRSAAPTVVIQSPMGGSITPEEIIKKTGPVDAVYIRVDENKAYWVKGEETGSVDLW